jgi:hypothetical protein
MQWRFKGIGVLFSLGAALVLGVVGFVPLVAKAESPVENHPGLNAAVTVWCLANPERLRVAAQGLGMNVGDEKGEFMIDGPREPGVFTNQWAQRGNHEDSANFEHACRIAFIAFRHAGVGLALYGLKPGQLAEALEESSGGGNDEMLSGAGGVLIGVALTGAGGALVGRRRAHKDDAEELRRLDAGLQTALAFHFGDLTDEKASNQARVRARELLTAIEEWRPRRERKAPKGIDETNVTVAADILKTMLCREVGVGIGRERRGQADEQREDVKKLRDGAAALHLSISKVAEEVGDFFRRGARKPPASG